MSDGDVNLQSVPKVLQLKLCIHFLSLPHVFQLHLLHPFWYDHHITILEKAKMVAFHPHMHVYTSSFRTNHIQSTNYIMCIWKQYTVLMKNSWNVKNLDICLFNARNFILFCSSSTSLIIHVSFALKVWFCSCSKTTQLLCQTQYAKILQLLQQNIAKRATVSGSTSHFTGTKI